MRTIMLQPVKEQEPCQPDSVTRPSSLQKKLALDGTLQPQLSLLPKTRSALLLPLALLSTLARESAHTVLQRGALGAPAHRHETDLEWPEDLRPLTQHLILPRQATPIPGSGDTKVERGIPSRSTASAAHNPRSSKRPCPVPPWGTRTGSRINELVLHLHHPDLVG